MASHSSHHASPTTATPFQPMAMFSNPVLGTWTHVGEAYAKACLAWQEQVFRFANERLRWDQDVLQSLANCKTFGDVVEVQKNWMMATAQDYFEEANQLAQLTYKFLPSLLPAAIIAKEETPRPSLNAA